MKVKRCDLDSVDLGPFGSGQSCFPSHKWGWGREAWGTHPSSHACGVSLLDEGLAAIPEFLKARIQQRGQLLAHKVPVIGGWNYERLELKPELQNPSTSTLPGYVMRNSHACQRSVSFGTIISLGVRQWVNSSLGRNCWRSLWATPGNQIGKEKRES